jgi:TraM recognition site of TraD and TraG
MINWRRTPQGRWPLDLKLAQIGREYWTLGNSFAGTLVMGATDSGKSSGPADFFSRKFLQNGFGGLVLCYKAKEKEDWLRRLKAAGREGDARVFGLGEPYRFNFLDWESTHKSSGLGQIDNLSNMLLNIASVRRTAPVGNEASWFLPQKQALVRNSLSLLLLAEERLTLKGVRKLLQSAPQSVDQANTKEWQKSSYLYSLLTTAKLKNPTHPELEETEDYWLNVRAAIPEKTRVLTTSEYLGMVNGPLSRGDLAALFATDTNLSPADCFDGKVIIVDVPVEDFDAAGQYAALIWQTAFMRATKRRHYQAPNDRPVFLFSDEAQAFSTDADADYHAVCRSHGVAVVRLTQNLPGFILSYGGGEQAKLKVAQLLGNLCTNIFLRNHCADTNAWVTKMIGKQTSYRQSLSGTNNANLTTSMSEAEEDCLPAKILQDLRNGGPDNDYTVDGIFFQVGRKWKNGERYITVEFAQQPDALASHAFSSLPPADPIPV